MNENCEKYFDMSSVRTHTEFDHPLYSILNKWETAELKMMKPKDYLLTISKNFNLSYADTVNGAAVNQKTVKRYVSDMKKGDKFPVGYYYKGKSGQEGRHRALAAMELGCDLIPVIEFSEVSDAQINRLMDRYRDMSREEVDSEFKEKGFHGISDLDWRELQNRKKWMKTGGTITVSYFDGELSFLNW